MSRLPLWERATDPEPHTLTRRDRAILEAIYTHDGILADYQIKHLFYRNARDLRTTHNRMRVLFDHEYVTRLDQKGRYQHDYMVYWLDRRGIEYIANRVAFSQVKDVRWRKPRSRWSLIDHDIQLNDFRISVVIALKALRVVLAFWLPEHEFHAQPDTITYLDQNEKKKRRNMIPDGFFVLADETDRRRVRRFFVELDTGKMDAITFIKNKVYPGCTYLVSEAYHQPRFGFVGGEKPHPDKPRGAWLVVTANERHLLELKTKIEETGIRHRGRWYLTTQDNILQVTVDERDKKHFHIRDDVNVIADAIWYRVGKKEPVSLLPSKT